MSEERWLSVADIADRLNIHPETVRTWIREGKLTGKGFGGRTGYRVRESDLGKFLETVPGKHRTHEKTAA